MKDKFEETIRLLYNEILGREPDSAGLFHYLKKFKSGEITSEVLQNLLLNSKEFQNKKADYSKSWKPNTLNEAKKAIATANPDQFEKSGIDFSIELKPYIKKEYEILDYGCGIGRIAKPLSKRVRLLHAVDVSEKMLSLGREFCSGYSNINFLKTNGRKISLPASSIDFAYSILTLQHVEREDMLIILKEIHRILKPDAKFYLTLPNLENEHNWKTFEEFSSNFSRRVAHRMRMYTFKEIEIFMKRIGFRIDEIKHSSENVPANFKLIVSKIR